MSSEPSCSDCKMELIQKKWTGILFKWLNKCVHPEKEIDTLSPTCLADIMNKYKADICDDDIDRAILCTDDIEPFIKYKYPILRLRYLSEDGDYKKKQYIMISVLLFHCCIKSHSGIVHEDIWKYMNKYEQEVILKFCERLDDMEITINNVDCAVKEAFDYVKYIQNISEDDMEASASDAHASIASEAHKPSIIAVPSDGSDPEKQDDPKQLTLKFNSSVTVLPSAITDTSTYSSLGSAEEEEESTSSSNQISGYTDSDEMNIYQSKEFAEIKSHRKPYNRDTPPGSAVYKRQFETPSEETYKMNINKDKNDDQKHFRDNVRRMREMESDVLNIRSEGIGTDTSDESKRNYTENVEKKYDEILGRKREEILNKKREEILAKKRKELMQNKWLEEKQIDDTRRKSFAPIRHEEPHKSPEGQKVEKIRAQPNCKPKKDEFIGIRHDFGKDGKDGKGKVYDEKGRIKHQPPDCDSWENIDNNHRGESFITTSAETKHLVKTVDSEAVESSMEIHYLDGCSCSHCILSGGKSPCHLTDEKTCGDPACSANKSKKNKKDSKMQQLNKGLSLKLMAKSEIQGKAKDIWETKKYHILITLGSIFLLMLLISLIAAVVPSSETPMRETINNSRRYVRFVSTHSPYQQKHTWICLNRICQIVYDDHDNNSHSATTYSSLSRCSLLCMGPQLWPYPIGYTHFSKKLVALATNRLEYKFQSLPSEAVHQFLAEAFKLFISDLARLERTDDEPPKNVTDDLTVKKIFIQIDVEIDPEPRLKINTEESYHLKIETVNNRIEVKISSASFCGVRHGLQTLSQMILLDQTTGKLITISSAIIKDAPSYRYRGLMIDTARNYIPVGDLLKTIDAMATVKLNTFHWRISDVTSFPLYLPNFPLLFEYGGYTRSMVYTKDDIKFLVDRAGIRGVRILIEIAAPGPVGRAWSWNPDTNCPSTSNAENFTCDNVLCLRLELRDSIMNVLQAIYSEILEMTNVNDIFHLSDGIFSLSNCYSLIEDRKGFLAKALNHLKEANKGILPKLPIIWQTPHLHMEYEAQTWEKFGVQLTEMPNNPADSMLSKFKVIHSSKWDLSCEIKKQRCTKYRTWQEMYSWKSWRNIEVFTIEGGEAILWTDIVNSGNLDSHLWPRAAAVAERLWSDMVANTTASGPVYVRLDSQRWRMVLNGVKVEPVWPLWCSLNPARCMEKVR